MKYFKSQLLFLLLVIPFIANAQFITTWKTDNPGPSNDNQITIPINGGGYNYNVDWGDGSSDTNLNIEQTHTYAVPGTYTVTITGTFPRIHFNAGGFFGDNTDYGKILTVEQWGNNAWTSMASAFSGCINLRINATDTPDLSGVTDLTHMFQECENLNDDISSWNVSNVTTMIGVFYDAKLFNQPLNAWDVSGVTDMTDLFRDATAFNQPLNNWNVGNVTNMDRTFSFAEAFNNDITTWEVSNVTNMNGMFGGAFAFNQDISFKLGGGNFGGDAWNTANVTNMGSMFSVAIAFNQDISNWNTSNVSNIVSMFSGASAFNQDISGWDISNVTDFRNLFLNANFFNQDLSGWNAFIPNITNMSSMFKGANAFNQDISGWDVSSVTDMSGMFANSTFNQDITGWSVDNVSNFAGMFENNTAFNQDISDINWDIANATDLRSMFKNATAFDQDLGGWDVGNVSLAFDMLDGAGLSVENYDKLLIGWENQNLQSNVNFGASGLFYCAGATARQNMITNRNWFITDAGSGCINVYKGNDTTGPQIFNAQPEVIDFGSINMSGTKSLNFTIENKLAVDITNFNVAISTNTGPAFSVTTTPPTIITAGTPLTISIDFTGLTIASFSETVTFSYNPVVGLSSTFSFDITGEVTLNPEPEIAVFEGNTIYGNTILSGTSTFYMGNQPRESNLTREITITNKGSANLDIDSLSVSAGSFTVPTSGFTVPVDSTQTITITLDGTISGTYSETITIEHNDGNGNEDPFTFTVEGTILGPEIEVYDGINIYSDPQIFSGQGYVVDFGTAIAGTDMVKQIVIINTGLVDLSVLDITISDTEFSIVPALTYPITVPAFVDGIPGADTLDIVLSGTTPGVFNASVSITSDDDAIPIFNFGVTGNIIDPNTPKVYWTDNNEINRSDLDGAGFQQYHTEPAFAPRGIAIDTLNSIVYWTNNWGQIRKGEIDDIGLTNVVDFMNDGIDIPRKMGGLALDVAGDAIYWISAYDGTIKKASLSDPDPANVTTTPIVTDLSNPIGIAINAAAGLMYYTENVPDTGGNNASLHQVQIDGSNDIILSTQTISGQQYTYNDVAVNPTDNSIYWTASNNDIYSPNGNIYEADLADVAGTTVSIPNASPNLPYGIDLDIENKRIYWTDLSEYMSFPPATVNAINIDGSDKKELQSNFPNLNNPLFIALDLSVAVCQDSPTADAGQDVFICSSDNVSLTGSTGGGASSSIWTTSGDGFFNNPSLENAIYTPGSNDVATGSVTLTLTANAINCTPVIDQMVVNISLPITVIDQSATVNVAETATIDVFNGGFVNAGDVITTTLLSQPQKGTVTINNDGTIEYTALEGNVGTDSFDFQIENQCNSTASATIIITIPNTAPSFNDGTASAIPGAPVTINITDLITDLNGNIDLTSIEIIQQPGSGAPATLDADNNLVVDYTGMIFFGVDEIVIRVCDFDGACTEASIFITVEALPIEAYNAVSPNGDGRHDFLEFKYIEAYPENQVKIFSRWGDIVFEIDGYNNQDNIFTGVANKGGNKELPTGTYYYTVVLKLPTDKFQTVKGYFELRR